MQTGSVEQWESLGVGTELNGLKTDIFSTPVDDFLKIFIYCKL